MSLLPKFFPFLILALVGSVASAQRPPSADEIAAAGSFDGQLYLNRSLGLTILAPGGWEFSTYSQNQVLVTSNRTHDLTQLSANTQVLFQSAPSKLMGGDRSAVFSAGIEILVIPQTAEQYAAVNRDLLLGAGSVSLSRDVYSTGFGNASFSAFEVTGKAKDTAYRQVYLATVRRKVAIFFVETFYDNRNTFAVEASLKTLKVSK